MKHLLKGIIYLDILNLETKLKGSNIIIDKGGNYFIDLSQLQHAELSAITQLTLFIANLSQNQKNKIFIALPSISLTNKERQSLQFDDDIRKSILNKRIKVNNFLKTVGFVKVLIKISETYNNDIYISEEYEFEREFKVEYFEYAFSTILDTKDTESYDYKYIYPLEWINCEEGIQDFSLIEYKIDKILGNPERGLDNLDVQALKNVILSELIKNVNVHSSSDPDMESRSKYALFTIGLINSNSLFRTHRAKRPNPIETSYINWLRDGNVKSQVEIYFGDVGSGILNNKYQNKYLRDTKTNSVRTPSELLKLAFQKWTSLQDNEPRRGTKGLYRIQRIINKYNGIFHITTGSINGGYIKANYTNEEWIDRICDYPFSGTFIQIKLCPFSEVKEFRFSLEKNNNNRIWKTFQYKNDIASFKKDIKNIDHNDNLLMIINLNDVQKEEEIMSLFEKFLYEFSFDCHPCPCVVYLLSKLGNDTIQIIVDSVNYKIQTEIQKSDIIQELDDESVYDPILVIGNNNKVFWCGGNIHLANILNESYQNIDLKISEILNNYTYDTIDNQDIVNGLKLTKDEEIRIKLLIHNDIKLIDIDKDERITFNFTDLDTLFEDKIINQIEYSDKGAFCTPKLEIVDNWLNVVALLKDNEYGYALTLHLKFKNEYDLEEKEKTFILIEHDQQKELAKAFATLNGIKPKNIRNILRDINSEIPRRTKLFPEDSKVIILTTIISSSETVRRLVKYAKRDSANVLAILTLCNYRKYDIKELKTWDEPTSILSIYQKHTEELSRSSQSSSEKYEKLLSKNLKHKNPNFEEEESINKKKKLIDEDLKKHIIKEKALHYNHIGIYRGRHFTFYLEKEKLLRNESKIWEDLKSLIDRWKAEFNVNDFLFYIPNNLINGKREVRSFYHFIKNHISPNIKIISEIPEFINDPNVVYFDFGIISGKSINNVIKRCHSVQNLFICILFNQAKNDDFEFYKKIKTLADESILYNANQINFKIDYLYKLKLNYYTSESCPICEHIRSLDRYKIDQEYMFKFSEDRQERLKLMESDEILKKEYPLSPQDFYYDDKEDKGGHNLSSELIMKMFEIKTLLEKAEANTQYRIEVFKFIYSIYENIEKEKSDSVSNLYALVYFLSHDINWLQKEPLVFKDLRIMLAVIAKNIATVSINNLSEEMRETNGTQTTGFKLAVRYKYAAISLLRSTDKLEFCQSISKIIKSSYNVEENYLSNNLTQNTLYHISSLFQNTYNKSSAYFESINRELKIIEEDKSIQLSIPQKLAFEKILDQTKRILKRISIKEINTNDINAKSLAIIKKLKSDKEEYYTTRHPFPDNCLSNMNLNEFDNDAIDDIKIYKEKSIHYRYFLMSSSQLAENWKRVHEFMSETILPYTSLLSDKIVRSKSFRNIFLDDSIYKILIEDGSIGISDEFSLLVNKIEQDPLTYLNCKNDYDYIHNIIYRNLISKGSKFFHFIDQFPAKLNSTIENKLAHNIKNTTTFNEIGNDILVFYSQEQMNDDFDFVYQNIKGKLNEGVKLEDVSLSIKIDKDLDPNSKYIYLYISYDSTDNYLGKPSYNGSLTQTKNEIENFGGELMFETRTDEKGFFNLKFKYLQYE